MLKKQTFTLTATVKTDNDYYAVANEINNAMQAHGAVVDWDLEVETDPEDVAQPNRKRLIALAAWAAGEQAKADLGLPSEWDQRDWLRHDSALSCGTACCIAGKVVLDDGGVPRVDNNEGFEDWTQTYDGYTFGQATMPDGETVYVREYARKALGLTYEQSGKLFSGTNGLVDVLRIVGELLRLTDEPETAEVG